MYYHSNKSRRRYNGFPKHDGCDFCQPETNSAGIVEESEYCYVIKNRSFYTQWEMSKVIDHLMVIPKRHVLSLSHLKTEEMTDIMTVIARYEGDHYDVFARSPGSKTRSVPHQHTHLIKTDHKPARGMFSWRRPYILWLFR
jgi:ATP adenylyltransferase